jgi:hypothetical protein
VPSYRNKAFLFGSVLPDLPLILTTIVCLIIDSASGAGGAGGEDADSVTSRLFNTWYFENPWVMAEHNLFHSQVTLLTMMLISYQCRWSFPFWVVVSAWIHATSDIPVHHDDGPLIFFPLNWEYRFRSPISYWDPAYHGVPFFICEHILDAVIILRECYLCLRAQRKKQQEVKKTDAEVTALSPQSSDDCPEIWTTI